MEQQRVCLSTLALGLGLGVGLGLASSSILTYNKCGTSHPSSQPTQLLELELMSQVIDGKDSTVTFSEFPYYLNEQTKVLLTNAAFVHLKQVDYTKFTKNLSPASRSILLTGPPGTEACHQMLAKALSHVFEAKLLLLDVNHLSLKMRGKYGDTRTGNDSKDSAKSSVQIASEHLFQLFERATIMIKEKLTFDSPPASAQRRSNSRTFDDTKLLSALFNVLSNLAQMGPVILYLRGIERWILKGQKSYLLFHKIIKKSSGTILILGSRIQDSLLEKGSGSPDEKLLASLFPYSIDIKPPEDNAKLMSWKTQLEEDMKAIQSQDNQNHILEVLSANDVVCDDLASICCSDTLLLSKYIEEIVMSAISHHVMSTEQLEYRAGRLVLSSKSLAYGLSLFQAGQLDDKDAKLQMEANPDSAKELQETSVKTEAKIEVEIELSGASKPDVSKSDASKIGDVEGPKSNSSKPLELPPDNEFEKRIRPEVIPAGEVGVSFKDIGALDNVKESLQELVMLPLRRPDLFNRGSLIKPCRGILLFGPPGTGKTMLAKAVATEAAASFINVSMSTITSKWFGEDEKNVRALFTLAAKVAPAVIFIDEVDSMLGQRSRVGEHETMRKIKNEFMAHWDGLRTKMGEQVLVLAATNRPFDLDEAIIRRFERRIMVGLPNAENREKILRRILEKENLEKDFDFKELAVMTEGYSGSDLKNLCIAAAYRPIRELLQKEQKVVAKKAAMQKPLEDDKQLSERSDAWYKNDSITSDEISNMNTSAGSDSGNYEISLRPLTMEDMRQTKNQVSASFATDGTGMAELQEWNELYGEGGSRKQQQLTYFL